ncbi:MAG TPA: hypothetical protein VL974_03725 [Magnetospirillum sp.]|jgi:hypothetical protein|nr:hypothetical protein [Magnetospirillum sp.]
MFGFSIRDLALGLLIGLAAGGWFGADWKEGQFAKSAAKQVQGELVEVQHRDLITQDAGQAAAEHKQTIQVITKTIVKEVPRYVSAKTDAACVIPYGTIRLLDAAARGVPLVPDASGKSDGDPSGVPLSAVVSAAAEDLGTGNETRQQLIDLQAWVRAQQAVAQ